jgi:hypothetical protein
LSALLFRLSEASPLPFPLNYGTLGVLALICFIVGLGAFALVKEPPQTQLGPRMRVIESSQLSEARLLGKLRVQS